MGNGQLLKPFLPINCLLTNKLYCKKIETGFEESLSFLPDKVSGSNLKPFKWSTRGQNCIYD